MPKKETMFSKNVGDFSVGGRVWIDKDGQFLIGVGKMRFLDLIREHGSMSKAAAALNMSYSKAWGLLDSMNSIWHTPLVTKKTGGAGGGGAEITEEGERVLAIYRELCNNFEQFLISQKELMEKL